MGDIYAFPPLAEGIDFLGRSYIDRLPTGIDIV